MTRDFIPRYGEYTEYEQKLIKDRTSNLKDLYRRFKERSVEANGPDVGFSLNIPEFLKIPLLYVNDLKEYKTFHDASGGTDTFKRAAYIARLVSIVRPIQIKNTLETSEELLSINAQFALYVFLSYSGLDTKGNSIPRSGFEKICQELLYVFEFRDPQKEMLVIIARLVGRASID